MTAILGNVCLLKDYSVSVFVANLIVIASNAFFKVAIYFSVLGLFVLGLRSLQSLLYSFSDWVKLCNDDFGGGLSSVAIKLKILVELHSLHLALLRLG